MKLVIPDHPYFPNPAFAPDESLLDELVRGAALETEGMDPTTFLLGYAPARIFERTLVSDPGRVPAKSHAWVLYCAGYFGGLWLRTRIREAQLDSMLTQLGSPPTREAFDAIVTHALGGTSAAKESDAEVIAYCETILPELVGAFGYNQGYLLEILCRPPGGASAPSAFLVPGGLLWCGYGRPHLEILPDLFDVSRKLQHSHDPGWNRLADWIPDTQGAEIERGHEVWSSSMSVEGFSQASYDQLLDLSSVFLEVIQATALTAVRAVAETDPLAARRAALAHTGVSSWGDGYRLGLMDNRQDDVDTVLPYFED